MKACDIVWEPVGVEDVINERNQVNSKQMKFEDLLQYSKIFASEFNNSTMHDRVLVFDVMEEDCGDRNDSNSSMVDSKIEKDHYGGVTDRPIFSSTTNNNMASEMCSDRTCDREKMVKIPEIDEIGGKDKKKEDRKHDGKERMKEETVENENRDEEEKEEVRIKAEVEEAAEQQQQQQQQEQQEDQEDRGEVEQKQDSNTEYTEEIVDKTDGEKNCEKTMQEIPIEGENYQVKNPKQQRLFIHSSWLAVQSSYFRALFYSGMKESNSKEVLIKVYRSELQAHLTLLEAMYRVDVLDDKEYDLVLKVLTLASKYYVHLVYKKCKYVLMSTSLTLKKCECILGAVKDLPDCADLLGVLEKFLVEAFKPLDKTWTMDKFYDLSEASLRLLLSSNDLSVCSENTAFAALMKWLEYNEEISPPTSSLLSLLRFELMTLDFLYDVVRNHSVATSMPGFHTHLMNGLAYHGFSQQRREKLKPVPRVLFTDEGPTLSWVIDESKRKEIKAFPSSGCLQAFWCRGYHMALKLLYQLESKCFGIYLNVLDMRKGSCLNIRWSAKSALFRPNSIVVNQMYEHGSSGWGRAKVESFFSFLHIPEHKSHAIDVWVKFI